jgi:hypothetical protein
VTQVDLQKSYSQDLFLGIIQGLINSEFKPSGLAIKTPQTAKNISVITNFGEFPGMDIQVFAVRHTTAKDARVAVTQDIFKIMKLHNFRHALIASYSDKEAWRCSFVSSDLEISSTGRITKNFSNPRRFSFLLGEQQKVNTPYKQLVQLGSVKEVDDLKKRFALEVVNNEFYKAISKLYDELVGTDKIAGVLKYPDQGEVSHEFAVRLIGRVIFCWFLREKKSQTNDIPLIPKGLLSSEAASVKNYYHDVLAPLFFEVLNMQPEKRSDKFQTGDYKLIPYLNGGLFSNDEIDHYKFDKTLEVSVPGLVNVPDKWLQKLFDVLELYNFTVDENTSYDIDLSIDPEMLGRVFENLLARINPETGETVRKSTGSFYTPREIVDYMVDASLTEYLLTKTKVNRTKIEALVSYDLEDDISNELTEEEGKEVLEALSTLTVLDPACGSGAFPIGMLQKIVFVISILDPDANWWLSKQLENASPEIKREFENKGVDYIRKLGIIRQTIFGVDIQPIATEISRLRCFLTLIVDEAIDDNAWNRDIKPLPNLDFKFVTANSIIKPPGNNDDLPKLFNTFEEELAEKVDKYFSSEGSERSELSHKIRDLIDQKINQNKDFVMNNYGIIKDDRFIDVYNQKNSKQNIELLRDATAWESYKNIFSHRPINFFEIKYIFPSVKDGFDIVIGNPPYIHFEKMDQTSRDLYKKTGYKTYEPRGDIYALFYERGLDLLKDNGVLTYITSNKWMRSGYGKCLRNLFVKSTQPVRLIDLGSGIFNSATVDTNIIVLKRTEYTKPTLTADTGTDFDIKNISGYIQKNTTMITFQRDDSWAILNPIEQSIKHKIEQYGTPLKNWDIQINYGVKTGLNEAFIIDKARREALIKTDPKSVELIRPILRGKDIKRNSYTFADKYLIATFPAKHYDINNFPAIRDYLLSFGKDRLEQSGKKNVDGKSTNARKKTNNKWYETQDSISYWDDFGKQKIIFSRISGNEPCFVLDDQGYMTNDTGYIITGNYLEYLLEQLTSDIIWFAFKRFYMGGGIEKEFKVNNLANLPVPLPQSRAIELTDDEINFISSPVS